MKNKDPLEILFIHPPLPANPRHKKVLPLGIAYVASYIRKHCLSVNVEVLDAHVLDMAFTETVKAVGCKKRDVIGISFWTLQAPFAYALAKDIRKKNPEAVIIFGGVHATSLPQEAAQFADYCVLHEGEETFRELIEYIRGNIALESIKGVAYLKDGKFIKAQPRPFFENLDFLPFPAWDLLPMDRYNTPLHVVGGKRVPIIGSRGCCYNCSYCVSPYVWGRKVRWRTPENVLSEMKAIIDKYGVRQFHFWDDNLLLDKEYIMRLCHLIINEKLDIQWVGLSRASHIVRHFDVLPLLKAAGCVGLEVGIESADEHTFENIHKEESIADLRRAFCLQRESGLYPLFTYMSLNPGENISTYSSQADFIDELLSGLPWCEYFHHLPFPAYVGQFCTPHVGTEFFAKKKEAGLVLSDDWSEYNHHTINFVPHSLLNDIPARSIRALRDEDYICCTKAAWGWIYGLYPHKQFFLKQLLRRCGFIFFLKIFFASCDGKRTTKEVAEITAKKLHINFKKSLQYSVFATIVLSQLGVLHSAAADKKFSGKIKTMSMFTGSKIKRKYRFLRFISFFLRTY